MRELIIQLQFITPCLGYVQRSRPEGGVIYTMPRDGAGQVVFLAGWWHEILNYAAKVKSRHQGLVRQISWNPHVQGALKTYQRPVPRRRKDGSVKRVGFALHEAYDAGSEITVLAVVPTNLSREDFNALLVTAGHYRGISPYQGEERWGKFNVVSVQLASRPLAT